MYLAPDKTRWSGRTTDPAAAPDYWYQVIQLLDLSHPIADDHGVHLALLGYACEEGVRRNQGRLGPSAGSGGAAAAGAKEVTKKLGRLANHLGEVCVADAGTVTCPEQDLEATQKAFGNRIARLLAANILPVGIGGGHDIAYAHYLGLREHLTKQGPGGRRLGILNFDAHFDLRPYPDGPTSGTPFRQILEADDDLSVIYFALGIQRAANPPSLFRAAEQYGVGCVTADACTATNVPRILELLGTFLSDVDHLYVTIDLDGFSSAYAPGVSAPSPLGFAPDFLFPVLRYLLSSGKVLSLDLAEFNPAFDRDGQTAVLAARIINEIALSLKE